MESYFDKIPSNKSSLYKNRVIGILLIIIGSFLILFTLAFRTLSLNAGVTLILSGLFLIFLITEKNETSEIVEKKIVKVIIAWTLVVFFITITVNIEILLILTFLGIFLIKEITDQSTSVHFKNRLNIFIFAFLLLFTYIVAKRIINF